MERTKVEMLVGVFVLVGLLCVGYLAIKLGRMEFIGDNHYPVFARFRSVSGLNTGVPVQIAGVPIGRVESIALDKSKYIAIVKFKIDKEIALPEDSIASVKTAGLIGDKYVSILPGGSEDILAPGEMITETESAVDIEEMISKYVFGGVE